MTTTSPRPQRERRLTDKAIAYRQEVEEKTRWQEENRRRKEEKAQKTKNPHHDPLPKDTDLIVSYFPVYFSSTDLYFQVETHTVPSRLATWQHRT